MTVKVDDKGENIYLTDPSLHIDRVIRGGQGAAFEAHISTGRLTPDCDTKFAIACLLAFVQANWTGPALPSDFPDWGREEHLQRLMQDGEMPYALVRFPWLLSLAQNILAQEGDAQWRWWYLRSLSLQGQLLDAPSASLTQMIRDLVEEHLMQAFEIWGPTIYVEASLHLQAIGEEQRSQELLQMASAASNFKFSLTGVLGRRTKFQTFDVAQLTVQVVTDDGSTTSASTLQSQQDTVQPINIPLQDEVLTETAILSSEPLGDACTSDAGKLILLGSISHLLHFHAKDSAVREKSTALVERVLEVPGDWSIHSTALSLRSQLEASKSRYIERAALQFQALVDQIHAHAESSFALRARHFFAVPYPSEWELDRQQGRLFASLGAFKTAATIFERRSMWDEYVACLMQLGERQQAENLILDQLERQPANPKMLCLLGDLREDASFYERAWEVSNCKFARAMRSLGMHYVRVGDNEKSITCFERALELNSLFDRIWFLLGCAAMQIGDWNRASTAFTRTIALDDDNSDAWNNLAAVHLQLGHPEQALRALKEAGKRQFDSWKIWNNIFRVSLSLGELLEAISAYRRVAEIREKEVPLDGLEIILTALEEVIQRLGLPDSLVKASLRQINYLLDTVMATHLSMSKEFWYLCARYAIIVRQPEEAIEFYFKAYRALPTAGWENDLDLVKMVLDCLLKIHASINQAEDHPSERINLQERRRQLKLMAEGLRDRASKNHKLSPELSSALRPVLD